MREIAGRVVKIPLHLTILIVMSLAISAMLNVGDPDYYWHLKAGEWIVSNRRLPETDPFLQSHGSTPWVLHEWLFQVILHHAFANFGLIGIRMLFGVLSFLTLLVVSSLIARYTTGFAAAWLLVCCFTALLLFNTPRPHWITFIFLGIYLERLSVYLDTHAVRALWPLPPLMVIWTNFHGAYILGLAVIGLMIVGEIIDGMARGHGTERLLAHVKPLVLCVLLAFGAAALNPYGFEHFLYPFHVVGLWITPLISEWRPASLQGTTYAGFFLLIVTYFLATVYRRHKPGAVELLVPCFLTLLAFSAGRHTGPASIALAAFAARAGADGGFKRLGQTAARIRTTLYRGRRHKSVQLGNVEYVLNWTVLAVAVAALILATPVIQERQLAKGNATLGWKAVDFIAEHNVRGPCINEYGFGGYYTFRLWPRERAFIDGRADLYPDAFAKEYAEMILGGPSWKNYFDKYEFECAVIPSRAPLRQLLLQGGMFSEVYSDGDAVVLVRNSL